MPSSLESRGGRFQEKNRANRHQELKENYIIKNCVKILTFRNRGVHAHSCIMGNQGKMTGNEKICIRIQSQLILPEFIYLILSLRKE